MSQPNPDRSIIVSERSKGENPLKSEFRTEYTYFHCENYLHHLILSQTQKSQILIAFVQSSKSGVPFF